MTDDKLLGIYLNDHLAGATAGVELARRLSGSHRDTPHGPLLERLATEIGEDRESLLQIMSAVGVGPAHYKTTAAWVAEKLGRLKLNGRLLDRSPLSSLVEVELMQLGVQGKSSGWRTLLALAPYDDRLEVAELQRLLARADDQIALLEGLRPAVTQAAFAG